MTVFLKSPRLAGLRDAGTTRGLAVERACGTPVRSAWLPTQTRRTTQHAGCVGGGPKCNRWLGLREAGRIGFRGDRR